MLEPEQLLKRVAARWAPGPLSGVRALVTAGPTREPIDPVRFVGNRSSGKMGYALAAALRELGGEVTLVSGPVVLPTPPGVERVSVETALEMRAAVMARVAACDLFAAAAAVADYRPQEVHFEKLKKQREQLQLRLVRNPDILAEVAALPQPPFTLGFAAETGDLAANAVSKLSAKGLDLIAANQVGDREGGFDSDRNALSLFWKGGGQELEMAPKVRLARQLARVVAERYRVARAGAQRTAEPS
jgi:phosphopantothenoylcysteine decarboxylase/phosphopantothenate--cysteine ligase